MDCSDIRKSSISRLYPKFFGSGIQKLVIWARHGLCFEGNVKQSITLCIAILIYFSIEAELWSFKCVCAFVTQPSLLC